VRFQLLMMYQPCVAAATAENGHKFVVEGEGMDEGQVGFETAPLLPALYMEDRIDAADFRGTSGPYIDE
jgi:hypothetical protein